AANSRCSEAAGTAWRSARAPSCSRWLTRNGPPPTTRPPAPNWISSAKTSVKSFSSLAFKTGAVVRKFWRPTTPPSCSFRVSRISRVDEERHDAGHGKQLVQHLQPLRRDFYVRLGHARNVAARPAEARNKAKLDRVRAHFEDDRDGRGRYLCRKRRRSAGRSNHGHLTMHQIGRHRRQPIVSPSAHRYSIATLRPST